MRNNHIKVLWGLVLLATLILLPACQKHEHVYGEWSTTSEATCVNDGVQTRTCSCGEEETKPINAAGHSYGEWITTVEATCVNDGVQTRTCNCGEEETMPISATGSHSYGDWVTTVEATCVNDGVQARACSCGEEETMPISATGSHSYGDWVTTVEATCANDGVKTRTCTCGAEETMPIGATGSHSYGNWVTTTAATCTNDGIQTRTCTCGAKESKSVSATGHSYGNWARTIAPTCTSEGEQARTCSCGHQETKVVRRLVHKWREATCTAPKTCSRCFATVGSVLEHSIACDGYCTGCGKKITVDMRILIGKPTDCSSLKNLGFFFSKNSSDEIKVCWGGQNLSGKTISSYSVTIYFYNSADGPAYSKITGKSSKTVVYKDTVSPKEDLFIFDIVDTVPDCSGIAIGDIKLEYLDGTSDTGWYGWGTKHQKSGMHQ